jgi:hypothetical protein
VTVNSFGCGLNEAAAEELKTFGVLLLMEVVTWQYRRMAMEAEAQNFMDGGM